MFDAVRKLYESYHNNINISKDHLHTEVLKKKIRTLKRNLGVGHCIKSTVVIR